MKSKKAKAKSAKKSSWWSRLVRKPKKTVKKAAKRKTVKRKNGVTVRVNKLPKYIYLTQK